MDETNRLYDITNLTPAAQAQGDTDMTNQGLIELWLVTRDADDLVTTSKRGTAKNLTEAMKKAKKLAGRGAKFVGSQGRCEYRGPNGKIHIGV